MYVGRDKGGRHLYRGSHYLSYCSSPSTNHLLVLSPVVLPIAAADVLLSVLIAIKARDGVIG